ncbi:DNase I-like protein [Pholiota molesta]|nr:DNase I-like protein [Pholiota molesta]
MSFRMVSERCRSTTRKWNTLKTFDDILNHLEADIVCFQEMKSSRQILPKQVAVPASFDSFFSFPTKKNGYSGIAVYTRRSAVVPLKAEEGLSGLVQPRPPLSDEERISSPSSYPAESSGDGDLDYKDWTARDAPCTGTEEREKFKMDYHRMLAARREVMVVGDLNACPAVEDHCEGRIIIERGWAEDNVAGGCVVDIVRKFWPERRGMYTCWNTKISARDTNYGTRIDFILITPGLVPWVKAADIQPNLIGSDHCPVFVDLHDEITKSDGSTTKLSDVLGAKPTPAGPAEPPRIAAKFWNEHRQKLALLSQTPPLISSEVLNMPDAMDLTAGPSSQSLTDTPKLPEALSQSAPCSPPPSTKRRIKAKLSPPVRETVKQKDKGKKAGQSTLAGFFAQPKASAQDFSSTIKRQRTPVDQLALKLSQSQDDIPSCPPPRVLRRRTTRKAAAVDDATSADAAAAVCVHQEPAKEFTVNKPGPNKGKKFFTCSRSACWTGYDKGRAERFREHVDPQYKCDFFMWSSDARKEMAKKGAANS